MEDSTKKPIMIIVIVACLAIAAWVTFRSDPGGGANSIPESEMQWVKCNNPACNAEYEMSKREYYKTLEEPESDGNRTHADHLQRVRQKEPLWRREVFKS